MTNSRVGVMSIAPLELKKLLDRGEEIYLLDVREPAEREICNIGGELIPVDQVTQHTDKIPRDRRVVVYCRSGSRSQTAIEELQKLGYRNLFNLSGGILRWATEIDPTMKRY